MIKLKNSQIAAFLNPIINKLFEDETRRFPTLDAFRFAELIMQIQNKALFYQDHSKKIIEKHGAKIGIDGSVSYPDTTKVADVQTELRILGNAEVEIPGDKIKWRDSWPNLSLQEAFILRPIVDMENHDAEKDGKKLKKAS